LIVVCQSLSETTQEGTPFCRARLGVVLKIESKWYVLRKELGWEPIPLYPIKNHMLIVDVYFLDRVEQHIKIARKILRRLRQGRKSSGKSLARASLAWNTKIIEPPGLGAPVVSAK